MTEWFGEFPSISWSLVVPADHLKCVSSHVSHLQCLPITHGIQSQLFIDLQEVILTCQQPLLYSPSSRRRHIGNTVNSQAAQAYLYHCCSFSLECFASRILHCSFLFLLGLCSDVTVLRNVYFFKIQNMLSKISSIPKALLSSISLPGIYIKTR